MLLFLESFALAASNAGLARRGWTCSGNPMSAADSPSTKGRGGGWGCPVRGYGEYFYRALGSNAATAIIGVARRLNTLGAGGFPDMATSFWDGATLQCWVGTDTTGHLVAYRGAGTGTVLATSTLTLTAGSYVFLEVLATVHNTTGSLQIRVNGAPWASFSGDTAATANNYATIVRFGSDGTTQTNNNQDLCDLYICDGTGARNNTFLGDSYVRYRLPTGAGATTQLTPLSGSNWQNVDDPSGANDGTDYNYSATVGQKDTYSLAALPDASSASVAGVQVTSIAAKDTAGARSIANVLRSGGSDYLGASQALATTYGAFIDRWEVDPATSAAWTEAAASAVQIGVTVAA